MPCTTSARCPSPSTSWTVSDHPLCPPAPSGCPPLPPLCVPALHSACPLQLLLGDTPNKGGFARCPVGSPITVRVPLTLCPPDLSKHRRYEIRMSVYNAVGEGPPSPPQEVFVGEAGESCTGASLGAAGGGLGCPGAPHGPAKAVTVTLSPPSAQCPPERRRTWLCRRPRPPSWMSPGSHPPSRARTGTYRATRYLGAAGTRSGTLGRC